MAVKDIVVMGQKQIYQPSTEIIEFGTSFLLDLIQDMKDTMEAKGGVGIAAPQVGCNVRVIMFGFENSTRYPNEKSVPFTIIVNPEIEILTHETYSKWEGCLSVPGLRGRVSRFTKIIYRGFDPQGNRIEQVAEDFHARILQHECDHLNGVLYVHKLDDMREFGFETVLQEQMKNNQTIL